MNNTAPLETSHRAAATAPSALTLERVGATVVVTLSRPQQMNALDSGMKVALANTIPSYARDPQLYGLVIKAAPGRIFCAGSDLNELADLVRASPVEALALLAREYALVWLLDCFSKPTVALMNGAVMGTGVSLTHFATHRVGGEDYRFQMPETAIGFFPDGGVSYLFARMPDEIGAYLGLTGAQIGRADAFRLNLLTHCIKADRFPRIEAGFSDVQPVDPLLDDAHEHPGPAPIDAYREVIGRCFSGASVVEIIDRLRSERQHATWCQQTLGVLEGRSPLALEVTLQHIRRARALDLRQTLVVDHRIARRLLVAPDFIEGVRCVLIDKTSAPAWRPARADDVSAAMVDRAFAPVPGEELVLPTRQEMQAARV